MANITKDQVRKWLRDQAIHQDNLIQSHLSVALNDSFSDFERRNSMLDAIREGAQRQKIRDILTQVEMLGIG